MKSNTRIRRLKTEILTISTAHERNDNLASNLSLLFRTSYVLYHTKKWQRIQTPQEAVLLPKTNLPHTFTYFKLVTRATGELTTS